MFDKRKRTWDPIRVRSSTRVVADLSRVIVASAAACVFITSLKTVTYFTYISKIIFMILVMMLVKRITCQVPLYLGYYVSKESVNTLGSRTILLFNFIAIQSFEFLFLINSVYLPSVYR